MTNRPYRHEDGKYHIKGKTYRELFGSRVQVWNNNAYKTTGGLTRAHLTMNKWRRIVSKTKHVTAKKEKRLQKYGFYAKKGKFGAVVKGTPKMKWSRTTAKNRKLKKMKKGGSEAAAPAVAAPSAPSVVPYTNDSKFASNAGSA